MKKIYALCVFLIAVLALLYFIRLRAMGIEIRYAAEFFMILAVTAGVGLLIVKIMTKKIRKNMDDN